MAALAREFASFINATPTPFQLVGVTAGVFALSSFRVGYHACCTAIMRTQHRREASSRNVRAAQRGRRLVRRAPMFGLGRRSLIRSLSPRRTGGALKPGGKYFFWRNHSTLVAFTIGGKYTAGNGFKVFALHSGTLMGKGIRPSGAAPPPAPTGHSQACMHV